MGSAQSVPTNGPTVDDGEPVVKKTATHIGNYMQGDVLKWEKVHESSKQKDSECGCEAEPKISKSSFMQPQVEEWEQLHGQTS
tara:strand:+ start:6138 stop:6386 length:249 start_codon:yes stop_codon:yes gene_type:complete